MKQVYLSMSADIIHNGHIRMIQRAAELGELTVGVLTDEAICRFKRYPLLDFQQRCEIIGNIKGVARIVPQKTLDYQENLLELKPDIVVHGDNWITGFQEPIRKRVIETLKTYGGELVEFPYYQSESLERIDQNTVKLLNMPENRRGRLRKLLELKKPVSIMEAHNGLTGLMVEKTKVEKDGKVLQFDGMWVSSLCDSTAKGKPDIELVDNSSRLRTIDDIMEVTTKPIILDGDTGGRTEHFMYLVQTLARIGVSAVIIEDKVGLKKNSLFGTDAGQTQAPVEEFCDKISAAKKVLRSNPDFMVIARIESLILNKGMDDALERAFAYIKAGADGIMIHSKSKEPDEVFEFCEKFRAKDAQTPLVVVPTTYNTVTEEEFGEHGVNIVIHANHLIRSAYPAMKKTLETILEHGRSKEADPYCMPIKEILTLIPEEVE
jgi:phosphoenolpyruvate mutase